MARGIFSIRLVYLVGVLNLAGTGTVFAFNALNSAIRPVDSDYQEIIQKGLRIYDIKTGLKLHATSTTIKSDLAVSLAVPFSDLDFTQLDAWQNPDDIGKAFVQGRDDRFMSWQIDSNDFPRRPTWLYPDDGCYARADVFRDHVKTKGFTETIYKLFVFGNLKVLTKNHPAGSVSWWYHVVPLIYDGVDAFVIDPAIDPSGPMLASDWAKSVNENGDSRISFAICSGITVGPYDACLKPKKDYAADSYVDQSGFFNSEWKRLISLQREPMIELGDLPPWNTDSIENLVEDIEDVNVNVNVNINTQPATNVEMTVPNSETVAEQPQTESSTNIVEEEETTK